MSMTEEQHIKLVEVGDEFWGELSNLVAKHVAKMPEEIMSETLAYFQDMCSVYGSTYDVFLPAWRVIYKT